MNSKEFSEWLARAFELKRQRAEELAGEKEQSLARVWARIQDWLKKGDLQEELE